jgi:hypothetical protein
MLAGNAFATPAKAEANKTAAMQLFSIFVLVIVFLPD